MKVEIDVSDGLLRKLKALSILDPMEGGIDSVVSLGLEAWVDAQIVGLITGREALVRPGETHVYHPAPQQVPQRTRRSQTLERSLPEGAASSDASGISSGLSDDLDDYEEEPLTRDPEAFVKPSGGLTEDSMDRDMRVSDPAHEAKMDASSIKERGFGETYATPEELFAEASGLPTPPPVMEDSRATKRRKKQTGRGRAIAFDGYEENPS